MKSKDEITELSHDSFIETYGRINGNYYSKEDDVSSDLPKINVSNNNQENHLQMTKSEEQNNSSDDNGSRKGSVGFLSFGSSYDSSSDNLLSSKLRGKREKLRKISAEKFSSLGDAIQAAVTSKRTKTKTSFTDKNGLPKLRYDRKGWLSSAPHFSQKLSDDSASLSTEENDTASLCSVKSEGRISDRYQAPNPLSIPGSRTGEYAHRGYLDCRNKKKRWERYWCVLQDACLYCYHSPQSDVTRDVILLRGYDVIADVTNLTRSKYLFRLQQQGFPTLHFSSDNHRDYLLWVGTLEKETRCVFSRNFSFSSEDGLVSKPSDTSLEASSSSLNTDTDQSLQVDDGLLKLQKDRLFNELALQKEQLLQEQKVLDKMETLSILDRSDSEITKKMTKEQIMDQYEKERLRQELKTRKFLTLLTRRRHSYHIKMTQYTKNLTPGLGQRNKENHNHFSAMEKKLKEMQESLALIDRELEEEEALKQHNLERLERKKDLELLIAEQQETIDVLRNHQTDKDRLSPFDSNMTASTSTESHDKLGSIYELSDDIMATSKDENVCGHISYSSSNFASLPNVAPYSRYILRSISEPCEEDYPLETDGKDQNRSSDEDSGFQVSVGTKADDSYEFYQSVIKSFFPSPEKKMNFDSLDANADFQDDFMDLPSKNSTLKASPPPVNPDEIDSTILAKIEDFELFAKLKLEEAKKV